jgi:8-oxo-dGTP diphosphatase
MSLSHREWKGLLEKVPMLTVDAVIFKGSRVLLVKRAIDPYRGCWGIPGGFLNRDETLEECLKREVKEETGLSVSPGKLIGIYDDPKRDPRGRVISIAYTAEIKGGEIRPEEGEISDIMFSDTLPENMVPSHKLVIEDAMKNKSL